MRRHRAIPTIKDVAARAGVSVATVSRVLNKRETTTPATRQRVLAAIAELGFRPNSIGRMLKTARSRSIGVLIPTLANPIFADSVSGVQQAAHENGYSVLLASSDYDASVEASVVEQLLSQRVDGLILTVADPNSSPTLDMLDSEAVPYVLVYNQPTVTGRAAIAVNKVAATCEIVSELVNRGHRNIGMVAGAFRNADQSPHCQKGFLLALRQARLRPGPLLRATYGDDDLLEPIRAVFSGANPPTALFCTSDLLALSTMRALRKLGRDIPDDVSVAGFDGIAVGELVEPSLTTVLQPSRRMGAEAFRFLLERLTGTTEPPGVVLVPHRLRIGESIGPPRVMAQALP